MDWEEVSQKIVKTSKDVSAKMKETSEVFRLRQKLAEEESRLQKVYAEIGKQYFENHEGVISDDMIPYFEKVTSIQAAIEEYQASINKIRKTKTCPACGATVDENALFCSSCGIKLDIENGGAMWKEN